MRVTGFVAVRKDRIGAEGEWIDFTTFHRIKGAVEDAVRATERRASHMESPMVRIVPAFIQTVEDPVAQPPKPPVEEPVNVDELAAHIIGNPWP